MPLSKRNAPEKAPVVETDSEDEIPLKKLHMTKVKNNSLCSDKDQNDNSSSSESDIENYLQPVDKIDLNSEFFKVQKKDRDEFRNIEENIFPGVTRLSDSFDSDLEIDGKHSKEPSVNDKHVSNLKLNFKQLEEYTKKIEEAKKHVEKYNSKKKDQDSKTNILKLLVAGESKQMSLENIRVEDLHPSDFESSEDDWEEVRIRDIQENKDTIPKKPLQISVDVMPDSCRKKKQVDLLAAMKRRLNRIRKENQVYVHQVHLLCWIAHGNYLNSVINSTNILGLALSLLPSDKCYPSNRTDLGYLEQIVQWYKRTIILKETPPVKDLDLENLLKIQINRKEAQNRKNFVLIFVAILRSLGIQCRIVMSLQVEPLRPPTCDLHSLAKENSIKNVKAKKSGGNIGRRKEVEKRRDMHVEIAKETMKARETIKNKKSFKARNLEVSKNENSANKNTNKSNKLKTKKNIQSSSVQETKKNEIKSIQIDKAKLKDNNISEQESTKVIENNSELKTKNEITKRTRKKVEKKVPQLDGPADSEEENPNVQCMLYCSQVDGASDSPTKSTQLKPNLRKLKSNKKVVHSNKSPNNKKTNLQILKSVQKSCPIKKHSSRLKLSHNENDSENEFSSTIKSPKPTTSNSLLSPSNQLDIKNDIVNLIKGRITEQKHVDRSRLVNKRKPVDQDSEDSDSDYIPEAIKKKHHDSDSDKEYFLPKAKIKRRIKVKTDPATGKRTVSSDTDLDEFGERKKKGINIWVEVFLEAEEKWITADIIRGQVHCVNELYARATHPVSYILAWNNNKTLKDVTRRYCKNYNTVTRKLRTDPKWWAETLKPFIGIPTIRDKEEDDDLNRQQLDQPMPKSISEYKNHPLYALKRHLLKFEALYPPNAVPVGYIRGEAVYPRSCVYVCRSRDIWLKEARVVKPGENPYKIVKARPKWDKLSNKVINDQLLEIFGEWQTMDYEPPTAENGVVPRNAFGNVELFKACMLPKGTVHLKLPNLNRICKKMNIDCASAIVGFDFHGGWSHPTYDGFVICEEYEDQVIVAWELDREEMEKKEIEKIEKRVFDSWKKLIKGMLIKQKLKAKYNFGESSTNKKKCNTKKRINSDSGSG